MLGRSACSGGLAKAWHFWQLAAGSSGFCSPPGSVAADTAAGPRAVTTAAKIVVHRGRAAASRGCMSGMVSAMLRLRDALFAAISVVACTPAPDGRSAPPPPSSAPEPARAGPQSSPPTGRTANDDLRGFANQPD